MALPVPNWVTPQGAQATDTLVLQWSDSGNLPPVASFTVSDA